MAMFALQIPMRHEIDGEKVAFFATDPSEGDALREFEEHVAAIVEREIEARLSDRLAKLEETVAEIRHLVSRPAPSPIVVCDREDDWGWNDEDEDEWFGYYDDEDEWA